MENTFAAYASDMAVAALAEKREEGEIEKQIRTAVQQIQWKDRERSLVWSKKNIEKRGKWLQIEKKGGGIRKVKTKMAKKIVAARTLLGVRRAMKLEVPERKEALIQSVYKLHKERAKKVGKECAEAWNILFGNK